MYFGNVSNFFYKNKEWLLKQPKISLRGKNNNIIKIGKQYYSLNVSTGKFSLIKPKLSSIKMDPSPSSFEKNESQKENMKYIQRTFNHTTKTPNPRIKNIINTDLNLKNNLSIKSKISNSDSSCDDKNKSNENTNIVSSFDKSEKFLLKNQEINNYIYRRNTEESIKNKKRKSKRYSSSKFKINYEFMNSIIPKIENDEIKSKLKFEKLENEKIKQNSLTKNKIKKLFVKKKNKEEFNSNITYVNCSKNRPNLSKTTCDSNKSKYKKINININIKIKKNNDKKISTFSPLDLNEEEFIKKLFPNLESLDINKDDSSYLRTIKDKILKRRIYDDLNTKYKFYQDSNNKRNNNDIPKINFKKTIILNRKEIFPPKVPLHHKLYFNHVNRQRQNDNKLYDIDYPLIQVK